MANLGPSRVDNDAFEFQLVVVLIFLVQTELFELIPLLLVLFELFHVLDPEGLSQLQPLFRVGLKVNLHRELKPAVDLCVHENVVIEYDSLQVYEE